MLRWNVFLLGIHSVYGMQGVAPNTAAWEIQNAAVSAHQQNQAARIDPHEVAMEALLSTPHIAKEIDPVAVRLSSFSMTCGLAYFHAAIIGPAIWLVVAARTELMRPWYSSFIPSSYIYFPVLTVSGHSLS